MLLIPAPLRPDRQRHADVATTQPVMTGMQELAVVDPPHRGAALMSLPDAGHKEVPAPAMPEVASIATTTVQLISPEALADEAEKRRQLDMELGVRPFTPPPGIYRFAVPQAELRAGPSVLERSTSLLSADERVEVLSRYADRWFFVRLADGKTEGYLDATLLSPAN